MTPRVSDGLEQTAFIEVSPLAACAAQVILILFASLMPSATLRQLRWVHYILLHRSDKGKTLTTMLKKTVSEHNELSLLQRHLNLSTLARHYLWWRNQYCLSWRVNWANLNWKQLLLYFRSTHTGLRKSCPTTLICCTSHWTAWLTASFTLLDAKQRRLGKITISHHIKGWEAIKMTFQSSSEFRVSLSGCGETWKSLSLCANKCLF